MIQELPILSIIIFLPLLGCLFILAIRGSEATIARNSRAVALWTSILTLVVSLVLVFNFDPVKTGYQFTEKHTWIKDLDIQYFIGLDGLSILFVVLSAFLTPLCILASWESIQHRVREYMLSFLLLETFMIGMFCALDLVVFYVFFEGVLIPMFLIIGIWGGERRIYSCFKFFLYTLLGSVLMLVAILTIYSQVGTTDLTMVAQHHFAHELQNWLWLAFFASFAVKVPMWPVHTWLPDAHVEAPTAGSVILAGILLKMGAYGFLRFSLPLFPEASLTFTPFVFSLSVIAIIYASLVALVQSDMKKLIAYSSVAHMGFVTLGIFTFTDQGISGAIVQMLSHGIVSAALFLCVGVVYDRLHTREIARYGGLVTLMPLYALMFMLFTLASVGLPGTSGFVGEFLVIVGTFKVNSTVALLAASGMVLGAAYALWLYRRIIFGKLHHLDLKGMRDLNWREGVILTSLVGMMTWMGIYPKPFLDIINPFATSMTQQMQQKIALTAPKTIAQTATPLAGQCQTCSTMTPLFFNTSYEKKFNRAGRMN
jgi:NADH-quinone oxidoreductase subunit M